MADRKFEVLWTATAARDLEQIASFIALDSPANARRILMRLRSRAEALSSMAFRGRIVPELKDFALEPWREILDKPYRIIYRISEDRVFVVAVLDGRRDVEDLLLRRLLGS